MNNETQICSEDHTNHIYKKMEKLDNNKGN